MRKLILLFVAGGMFGSGLAMSGMTNPARVIGFLDVFGAWDPTLAFVMGGAVGSYAIAMAVLRRRWPASCPAQDRKGPISKRLVLGAVLFGIGWGIAGFCPGPALADFAALRIEALWFVPAMAIGMILSQRFLGADRD